ncbi:Sec-independent protein translocase protein TatB [Thiomicrorhabdus immobilis]|uniref:Sec-independent protein translocase protein TatB n=1 Tax=Thiomicrorhabdus immobilis TaxID=2791037 RepID=A0ABN6CXT1_9GAMM|nr:Sec-independent protein translocase protein TatB [Thiomicrorhabdus immobilis]BCN92404.1 Sec-independent protein translocase protein TatB [Thiomicrorhabdus immobilis]
MFDIGFLELMVILVIALLVIGPERMPEVARKIGTFMGKMRRFVNSVKEDGQVQETLREIQQSMNLEEEKKQMDSIGKELEQGLNFNDVNLDDFQRPTFGGEAPPETTSQFNKAPAQPVAPIKPAASAQPSASNDTASQASNSPEQPAQPVQAEAPSEPAVTEPAKETQKS